MTRKTLLIVDDNETSLENLALSAKTHGYDFELAGSYNEAIEKLENSTFDVLIADLKLPFRNGLDIIEYAQKNNRAYGFILITGFSDESSIIKALKMGVNDILKKPYEEKEFQTAVSNILKMKALEEENKELKEKLELENKILKQQVFTDVEPDFVVGKNPQIRQALEKAEQLSKYSETCLLVGESGTGKEMFAKLIHKTGPRKDKPFIPVNCAAISPSLFESELFGFMKGSFTNAHESRPGLFETANGGTILLDEITEIPLELQAKLLRVIETKEIRRVGSSSSIFVDVQIIATTNRKYSELGNPKILRQDLFHRLMSSFIYLPPLRERREDIPLLLEHYLKFFEERFKKTSVPIPPDIYTKLLNEEWKGNIRQLVNFARHWVLFDGKDYNTVLENWETAEFTLKPKASLIYEFTEGTLKELEDAKKWLVQKALERFNYNKSRAARHLGMTYVGLHRYMRRNGME